MRILDKAAPALGLCRPWFFSDDQETFEKLIGLPDGIILVTGPTGSGKTTTLYACLNYINKPDRKIITVEDPVEYELAGINQVQVNEDIGLTFAAALRSMLRQAPNVIMIGEIRDLETANIAINASLTGHLVFSTLHTNDAPERRRPSDRHRRQAVPRRLRGPRDHGPAPRAQALPECKQPGELAEKEMRALEPRRRPAWPSDASWCPVGCDNCRSTGYRGRLGIFEIFMIDDEVRAHDQRAASHRRSSASAPASWACAPCARTASARCWPA